MRSVCGRERCRWALSFFFYLRTITGAKLPDPEMSVLVSVVSKRFSRLDRFRFVFLDKSWFLVNSYKEAASERT